MKAPELEYLRADSIDEAVAALAANADRAKVLAGGQSLLPVLNLRLAAPELLIDISRIPDLLGDGLRADGRRRYGAAIVHSEFEDGRVADAANGLLQATAAGIGYRAIRNRGTIGGSLAHADPSAEWPVVMAALGAQVAVRSVRGQREIDCADLFQGYFTTSIADDELLTDILITPLSAGTGWGLYKFARKAGEFAESIAVVTIAGAGAGSTPDSTSAAAWLGGATGAPLRLVAVESALAAGALLTQQDVVGLVEQDLAAAGADNDPYRRNLHGVTAWRAICDALRTREET